MKYQYIHYNIPKARRGEYNLKVQNLIASQHPDTTDTDIFNVYTGLGGLHGLSRADYSSYHAYGEEKKEFELGQFFTPPPLCEQIVSSLQPTDKHIIADLTCGSGNFFNYLPIEANCYGCEIEETAYNVCKYLYPQATIGLADFTKFNFPCKFDLVIGNPPFNIYTSMGMSQYAFIKIAARYLKPSGLLAFIAPAKFLEDEYVNSRKWDEIAESFDFICQCKLPASWFNIGIDVKVMYFQRHGIEPKHTRYSNTYRAFDPAQIYAEHIEPIYTFNKANAAKLHLLSIQGNIEQDEEFDCHGVKINYTEKITKYLYELKKHKALNKHLKIALKNIHTLQTQQRPDGMKYEEWEKTRLKAKTVANWMKKVISEQYKKPVKQLKVVKTNYTIKIKAYHQSLAGEQSAKPINDLIQSSEPVTNFHKLIERKRRWFALHEIPIHELKRNETLDQYLQQFQLEDIGNGLSLFEESEIIKLKDKQIQDCGLAFQRNYTLLAWQQGGGKSIAAMCWIKYKEPFVKQTFVVAPALAINLTWKPRLEKYGFKYLHVTSWRDIYKAKPKQVLIMSYDFVRDNQRHLKLLVKRLSKKINVVVDESDELVNPSSARTKAMLNVFRRKKYMLETTGTTTRNNINELYSQLELLYNNSALFICHCPIIYKTDEDNEIVEENNFRQGEPFPAYRGHTLFKYCFCPQKTSVFGIKKDTQDIYNADVLKTLIQKTVITRTFDDLKGEKIYEIKTHNLVQCEEERELYVKIMKEFEALVYEYFTKTDDHRKDINLRLIRQISLLIQSTSTPHLFSHYTGKRLPEKFYFVRDMIKEREKQKIAIGTVFIEAAQEYHKFITREFLHRPVFYIDGSTTFNQRKKIIAKFQATRNGILISTQGALKSSVDIETCDECILEAKQWNIPRMAQYYFRFIRLNSTTKKKIHFISYADTIEQNIMALLMAKEKLNKFVQETEKQNREDIFEEFDVDLNILNQLVEKDYDKDGNLVLRWGQQKLVA